MKDGRYQAPQKLHELGWPIERPEEFQAPMEGDLNGDGWLDMVVMDEGHPGLRIGYMVVPDHLVDAFRSIRVLIDSHPSSVAQAALAYFISEGSLSAHIRRMRALYSTRQATLIELVRQELGGFLKLTPKDAGMHLLAELPRGLDDTQLPQKLCSAGVQAPPLSAFYDKTPSRSGFLLGYAGFGETEMTNATRTLAQIIPKT